MFYKEVLEKTKDMEFSKENIDQIIRLFSIFLCSNSDFKYNQTYFTDSIDDFFHTIKIFQRKYAICSNSLNILLSCLDKYVNPPSIKIIFDRIFMCHLSKNFNISILENVESFLFFDIDNNNLLFQCETEDDIIHQYLFRISCKNSKESEVHEHIKKNFEVFLSSLNLKGKPVIGVHDYEYKKHQAI
jgi:hypothetical protein